jgi:hypothetical protein
MTTKMRSFCYVFLFFEIVFVLTVGSVLNQPMTSTQFQGTISRKIGFNTIVMNTEYGRQIYPNVPSDIFSQIVVEQQSNMSCNVGEWIPVLLDCTIRIYPMPNGNQEL